MRSLYQKAWVVLSLAAATFLISAMAAAQGIGFSNADFSGAFTLPFEAQWGGMTLPAGDYTLRFGTLLHGAELVEVRGIGKGSPHGYVLPKRQDSNSAAKNRLVCLSTGKTYVVGALELPAIGATLTFGAPRGLKILAQERGNGHAMQLAEVRVPIKMSGR